VQCIDLGSLAKPEAKLIAAREALRAIWFEAVRSWKSALDKSESDDARCPVFIVIDEAHNLAPAEPPSKLAQSVNETLARIATEGRKFGLFLILVTQRPSRLDRTLLSQCDNLMLLKMNNFADLRLVEKSFGFLPEGMAQRALKFQTGDALLSGSFVDYPVCVHIAPRRTSEGGRNLTDSWLEDPLAKAPATN
jgi:DNA helicase HerA-like ATPase